VDLSLVMLALLVLVREIPLVLLAVLVLLVIVMMRL